MKRGVCRSKEGKGSTDEYREGCVGVTRGMRGADEYREGCTGVKKGWGCT